LNKNQVYNKEKGGVTMGNNIRTLRKAAGLTMKQFGSMMGVSESTISLYETEKVEPDISMLKKMAEYFGVSIDALLYGNSENKKIQQTSIPGLPDETLIQLLADLTQVETQRVCDFVEGLKASRKE
jgi:transcriptional regulator with XRE-family HTH domain